MKRHKYKEIDLKTDREGNEKRKPEGTKTETGIERETKK